jgi:hypothetical protein
VAGSETQPDPSGPVSTPRGGARRAAKPKRAVRPRLVLLGLGSLAAVLVWAALVWLAIGFGRDARGGDSGRWAYLAAASVGAVLVLFLALWLFTTLLRRAGILEDTRPARPARSHEPHKH